MIKESIHAPLHSGKGDDAPVLKLPPANVLRKQSKTWHTGVRLFTDYKTNCSGNWSQGEEAKSNITGTAGLHSPVASTEREAATSIRWWTSSGLSLTMTELMLSFSIRTRLKGELSGDGCSSTREAVSDAKPTRNTFQRQSNMQTQAQQAQYTTAQSALSLLTLEPWGWSSTPSALPPLV